MSSGGAVFFTMAAGPDQVPGTVLLENSIRSFGGPLAGSRIILFRGSADLFCGERDLDARTEVVTLDVPGDIRGYPFAGKVAAFSRAEEMTAGLTGSLVWMSHDTLVVAPPVLMVLGAGEAAAARPVHISNVGIPVGEPPDPFWGGVYGSMGLEDVDVQVESFVDGKVLRAYYNSHTISVSPAAGICGRWLEGFSRLVLDVGFQRGPCSDPLHRVFLHQAVLSTVLAGLPEGALRTLPPEYGYPYNLHGSVPGDRRAFSTKDLVSMAYEDRPLAPELILDIRVDEPLRTWLLDRRGNPDG